MSGKVLGPEWGNLAGLPAEKALEYVAQYAADLEKKQNSPGKPAVRGGEDDDESGKPNSLDIAASLNRQSKAPLDAQFVGKRENARREARAQVEKLGYNWSDLETTIESAMAGATPEQQTDSRAWVASFVYAFGQADITKRVKRDASGESNDQSPPRVEYEDDVVTAGPMNGERGNRMPVNQKQKARIEDPVEQNTKRQFEKVLGYKIPDEEWIALQDPDMIKTQDDWDEFQAIQKAKGGR